MFFFSSQQMSLKRMWTGGYCQATREWCLLGWHVHFKITANAVTAAGDSESNAHTTSCFYNEFVRWQQNNPSEASILAWMNIKRICQIPRPFRSIGNVLTLWQSSITQCVHWNIFTVQEWAIFQSNTPALFLKREDGTESWKNGLCRLPLMLMMPSTF